MSLRRRIGAAEFQLGRRRVMVVPVFLRGRDDEEARERAERALGYGAKIRLITCALSLQAETDEEAHALLAENRRLEKDQCAIEVYRRGGSAEVLASWEPEPPAWLQALTNDDLA